MVRVMYLQVAQLKEEVSELEALQEVHEQLVESNHELEQDLREELDMAHAATREVSLSPCALCPPHHVPTAVHHADAPCPVPFRL